MFCDPLSKFSLQSVSKGSSETGSLDYTAVYKTTHGCIDFTVGRIMNFLIDNRWLLILFGIVLGLYLTFLGLKTF
jgi:hypothetical protein